MGWLESPAQHYETLGQFTPAQWDKDEWYPLLGPWRFIQVLSLCVIFMTIELNTFFLKFCLWIPPRNPLIVYRLVLRWLIAIPTIREYNTYLQDRDSVKKVGSFCWLSLAICIIEFLICIKFGHGLFPKSMPSWLIIFWTAVATLLTMFLFVWTWKIYRTLIRKRLRPKPLFSLAHTILFSSDSILPCKCPFKLCTCSSSH